MPFILHKDDIAVWIDPETKPEIVSQLMKPFDETQMSAHSISKEASYVNKDRNYPEIKEAVEYNETPQGDLFG